MRDGADRPAREPQKLDPRFHLSLGVGLAMFALTLLAFLVYLWLRAGQAEGDVLCLFCMVRGYGTGRFFHPASGARNG
jgi:hypothetical protein